MALIDNLHNRFSNENIVGKYIYANIAVFIAIALAGVFATLFNVSSDFASAITWLELPASLKKFIYCPWTIVSYMFIHAGFMHILCNMAALYFFGRIFLSFYSTRHFIGVYFLGGIAGGIFFIAAYNIFPYFEKYIEQATLVGASAAVLAVVTAAATRTPNHKMEIPLIGSVRLATIAIITVLISLLLLSSENGGGEFAHIGGALAGWIFAIMLNGGRDITTLITKITELCASLFSRIKKNTKKPKMQFTRGAGKHSSDYEFNARKKAQEDEINRILEKIKKSGYTSLSEEEKKRLFEMSDK